MLASYLLATDHVAQEAGTEHIQFADPDPISFGFDVPPKEAIDYFKGKKVVTRKQFDKLADDARNAAFTVSGVYKKDVINGFKTEITNSLETGTAQKKVLAKFKEIAKGAGHKELGDFHLETVYRTNMQVSYGVGRRRALEEVTDDLPYWEYHDAGDDRVRDSHRALNGIVLPANDPFWDDHFPPWSFNCRCSVTARAGLPDSYNPESPAGDENVKIFYDDKGKPAKAEIDTRVIDLAVGDFRGIPKQGGLKDVIETGVKRARATRKPRRAESPSVKPALPASSAIGTPVSQALNVTGTAKFKAEMKTVSDLIDQVHGDGTLPTIPLIANASRTTYGSYQHSLGRPTRINVSKHGDHKELTGLHEIGHFLDQQGIGSRQFASESDPRMEAFRKVAAESKAIKSLEELKGKRKVDVNYNGQSLSYTLDQQYIRYLLRKREIWARAYSQYVAKKTGNPKALDQLNKLREPRGQVYYAKQWEDDDFEPIAKAIDELLKNLGWMK